VTGWRVDSVDLADLAEPADPADLAVDAGILPRNL
jgi:hypothetical protein